LVNCKNRAGFIITNNAYLISNYHVVKDAAKVRLLTSQKQMKKAE